MILQQLVFGYDEGHRFLGGSIDLSPRELAGLLGATDAAPGGDDRRLVTAMPLASQEWYAICFTWTAPDVSRPGAVWAHVLLAPSDYIAHAEDPIAVAQFARRPSISTIDMYRDPVEAVSDNPAQQAMPVSRDLLTEVLAALYLPSANAVAVEQDLSAAEQALGVVWRIQWPELRTAFSFRTRDNVRDTRRADITIARRLKGASRQVTPTQAPEWIGELADEALGITAATPFVDFLHEFGPFDAAEPSAVFRLATVYDALRRGSPADIRDAIVGAYPDAMLGKQVKWIVFGGELSDADRRRQLLLALLGSGTDGWDEFQLHLPEQIEDLISSMGVAAFGSALAASAAPGIRRAARLALLQRRDPKDLPPLTESHLDLVLEVVGDMPALLETRDAWRGVSEDAAEAMLTAAGPPTSGTIAAAVSGGQAVPVLHHFGAVQTLDALADADDFKAAKSASRRLSWKELLSASSESEKAALVVAALAREGDTLPLSLLQALEDERDHPSELWLRAAVAAVGISGLPPRDVLPVVFGPLHDAMTADRLPRECWRLLDPVLPEAPDPAQRIRRYLIEEARRDAWTEEEFGAALADAGPYTSQLQHDFEGSGDDWFSVGRAVLRALGLGR